MTQNLDLYKNNPPRVWSRIGVELLLDSGAITPIGKFCLFFINLLYNYKIPKLIRRFKEWVKLSDIKH